MLITMSMFFTTPFVHSLFYFMIFQLELKKSMERMHVRLNSMTYHLLTAGLELLPLSSGAAMNENADLVTTIYLEAVSRGIFSKSIDFAPLESASSETAPHVINISSFPPASSRAAVRVAMREIEKWNNHRSGNAARSHSRDILIYAAPLSSDRAEGQLFPSEIRQLIYAALQGKDCLEKESVNIYRQRNKKKTDPMTLQRSQGKSEDIITSSTILSKQLKRIGLAISAAGSVYTASYVVALFSSILNEGSAFPLFSVSDAGNLVALSMISLGVWLNVSGHKKIGDLVHAPTAFDPKSVQSIPKMTAVMPLNHGTPTVPSATAEHLASMSSRILGNATISVDNDMHNLLSFRSRHVQEGRGSPLTGGQPRQQQVLQQHAKLQQQQLHNSYILQQQTGRKVRKWDNQPHPPKPSADGPAGNVTDRQKSNLLEQEEKNAFEPSKKPVYRAVDKANELQQSLFLNQIQQNTIKLKKMKEESSVRAQYDFFKAKVETTSLLKKLKESDVSNSRSHESGLLRTDGARSPVLSSSLSSLPQKPFVVSAQAEPDIPVGALPGIRAMLALEFGITAIEDFNSHELQSNGLPSNEAVDEVHKFRHSGEADCSLSRSRRKPETGVLLIRRNNVQKSSNRSSDHSDFLL